MGAISLFQQCGYPRQDRGVPSYLYKGTVRVLPLAMVDDINAISKCGIDSVDLNTFVNTHIELKKLRFHVPDIEGKSKCHKIHVGGKKESCPELKVPGTIIESVEEDTYLGDLISGDGKNKKNIEKRISKGLGIISQILNLLELVSFGKHYIEIALLLRESMFINGVLFNAEVWYGLTKAEINEFEKLDRLLLRKILAVPFSTPQEAFYLELGIVPISVVIKIRRLQYLHNLVNRKEKEMIHQFFVTQWMNPTRGDWTETVRKDLEEFGIQEDIEFLKSKSKGIFKRLLKKKAREIAFESLVEMKVKHSKMNNLEYKELKLQEYFQLPGIRIEQVRKIFKFRTRMLPFGENFRGAKEIVICPLCRSHADSQALCLQCPAMMKELSSSVKLDGIYGDEVTIETAETIEEIMKIRKRIIENG